MESDTYHKALRVYDEICKEKEKSERLIERNGLPWR